MAGWAAVRWRYRRNALCRHGGLSNERLDCLRRTAIRAFHCRRRSVIDAGAVAPAFSCGVAGKVADAGSHGWGSGHGVRGFRHALYGDGRRLLRSGK